MTGINSSYKNNFEDILKNTLRLFGKKLPKEYLDWLSSNPLYPSLKLLEIAFKKIGFSALVAKIESNQLLQIPLPAIAYLSESGGKFVTITDVDEKVHYEDSILGKRSEDFILFTQKWNNIILLLEEKPEENDKNFYSLFIKNKSYYYGLILLSVFIFLLIGNTLFYEISRDSLFYGILSIFGIGISLTIKSLESNILSNSVCSIGSSIDCSSVLNSKGAYISKNIKASDVGLFWYLFIFFGVFFFQIESHNLTFFNFLGFLSIIYVPYSLIYQWIVIKKWCLFCLVIQFFLLTHFLYALTNISNIWGEELVFKTFWIYFSSLVLSVFITYFYKHFLTQFVLNSEAALSRNMFALDEDILAFQLQKNQIITSNLGEALIKTFEGPDKRVDFCMVMNPLCDSCIRSFNEIIKLQEIDSTITISIILVKKWFTNEEEKIFRLIFSEDIKKRFSLLKRIMLNEGYNLNIQKAENLEELVLVHQDWFENSNLKFTPRFLIDDRLVPTSYNIKDIIYHLSEK